LPNPYFAFKKFTVYHDACAMKVGTDGCILGAWASATNPKNILDVGAGTGLLSLMLAQRFEFAQIEALEIDPHCAKQCAENVANSPFVDRVKTYTTALQNFETSVKYDLIVSNPPYFKNALLPETEQRKTARHDAELNAESLFFYTSKILEQSGKICIVIPFDRCEDFLREAQKNKLFLQQKTTVKPTPQKPPKRVMLQFGFDENDLTENEIFIEKSRGVYSEDFTQLLGDFYLYL
jgi:tRNA1Val (adenine37-N6)-methyltransferase